MCASPVDPQGLEEFSVVYTDRSLNHMSKRFQDTMTSLHAGLCDVYNAKSCVFVPGGGTYAMESVARQFSNGAKTLVIRNGWFSYRWTQINEFAGLSSSEEVLCAESNNQPNPQFSPVAVEKACEQIAAHKPQVVLMPHVETASGMMLPDDYIEAVAKAAHDVGALVVVDCIASGCVWLDMEALDIDVLISAPQKGWSSTPCAGVVLMRDRALAQLETTTSSSFAQDLKKWHQIMAAYLAGGHAYHATMPTDGLVTFYQAFLEAKEVGFDTLKAAQLELGTKVRKLLADKGFKSVAAPGFEAPGVVVSYTDHDSIHKGAAFAKVGYQIAAGVPLQVGEPSDFKTFRVGLFGLDKLTQVDQTVQRFERGLDQVLEAL